MCHLSYKADTFVLQYLCFRYKKDKEIIIYFPILLKKQNRSDI